MVISMAGLTEDSTTAVLLAADMTRARLATVNISPVALSRHAAAATCRLWVILVNAMRVKFLMVHQTA